MFCFTRQQSLNLARADTNYSTMFNDSRKNCFEFFLVITVKKQEDLPLKPSFALYRFFNSFKLRNSVLLPPPEHGGSKADLRDGEIRSSQPMRTGSATGNAYLVHEAVLWDLLDQPNTDLKHCQRVYPP